MNDELMHFGILGMKWGVRRYQKEDGARTKLGKEHRAELEGNNEKETMKKNDYKKASDEYIKTPSWNRIDTPIAKELLSSNAYNAFIDSMKRQEEMENKALQDKSSDLYKAAHSVAEQYKQKAGDSFDQETYDYYNEIGGMDGFEKVLFEYSKMNPEYSEARNKAINAIDSLYEESKPISKKYFGDTYDLTRDDVYELAYDKYTRDVLNHSDTSSDELMHYGILGMKWGIRRYQKENGSLTKAGRERYGVGEGNNEKSGPKNRPESNVSSEAESKPKARPASEMSDEELRSALNRLDMERRYNELTNPIRNDQRNAVDDRDYTMLPRTVTNVSNADLDAYIKRIKLEQEYSKLTAPPPKELTAGQKFMKDFAGPILATVAKEYVTKALKRAVGLEGDNNNNKNNNNNGDNDKLNKRLNNIENSINSLRNSQNGGGKQDKSAKNQSKDMDKRFDELKAMISDGIKSNLPVPVDNSGSGSNLPVPTKPTYKERKNHLVSLGKQMVDASRERQANSRQLQSELARLRARREERERRERNSGIASAARQDARNSGAERSRQLQADMAERQRNNAYYSTWTYGM